MRNAKAKRVVVISDLHCGHRVGLTPPGWQLAPVEEDEHQRLKWVRVERDAWAWYDKTIRSLGPIDILIVNGDAIDGQGTRSGGTELLTTDRNKQVDMALKCIRQAKADQVMMVRGTPYHTGEAEDMEDAIASLLECKIGDHEWYDVNGVILDCKHFIGGSQIPHGRATPLLRDQLWNILWSVEGEQPRADILIRSHVHYHIAISDISAGRKRVSLTTPALQAMGTKFGARRCSGHVQFGLVSFDITDKENWTWKVHAMNLPSQKASAVKL